MTTFHDGMELGNWQAGKAEADRLDIGLSDISRQQTPPPSAWDYAKQSYVDAVRVSNISAHAQNLNQAYDEINDRIAAATGAKDLFNPMLAEASGMLPVKSPDGTVPTGNLFEAWTQRVRALQAQHPDKMDWEQILAEPERRAYAIMKDTRERTDQMTEKLGLIQGKDIPGLRYVPLVREIAAFNANMVKAPGPFLAQIGGGLVGQMRSPVDAAVNMIGGVAGAPAKSLIRNALINAAVNAGAQMPLSGFKQSDYQRAGLPHGFDVWLSEVEGAASAGFAIDMAIRGPVRAYRALMGAKGLGGVVFDAVPHLNLPERPEGTPKIDPKTFEAAAAGDIKATRDILESTGLIRDDAIRGALDHLETGGKLDREMMDRLAEMGVAHGEGFRVLANLLNDGYARAPDRLARDIDRISNPPEPPVRPDVVDRVVNLARAELDRITPNLSDIVHMAVDARVPEVEAIVRKAMARLDKSDAPTIARMVADEMRALMQRKGPEVATAAMIASGAAHPVEIAAAIRRTPEAKAYLHSDIERHSQALALASLDEASFARVASGELPAQFAAHIADTVPPRHHAQAIDDAIRAKPESLDDLRRVLDELSPSEGLAADRTHAANIDDPSGAKAAAQLETLRQDQADAITQASEAPKERAKLDSEVERLKGDLAKMDAPDRMAALSDKDAMARAKKRAELHEAESRLAAVQADLNPDKAGALELYRAAMAMIDMKRQADVFDAVRTAVALGRQMLPEGVRIDVRTDEIRSPDGHLLDASSDMATGDIALAYHALDPVARMGHEAVHTLVTKGLISPEDVAALAKLAREANTFGNEAKYREAYKDRPGLERQIEEEAAASYIEATIKGETKLPKNDVVNRIRQFIAKLKALLAGYGFKTPEDIVAAIVNGEAARREPVRAWMRQNDITAMAVNNRDSANVMAALSDRDTGQSMRRDLDALGYYSQALEAARNLKQAKGTPEQMLAQLKSAGVKDAEIEATGLRAALDGKTSVTRDEIVQHLESNRVGVREVVAQPWKIPDRISEKDPYIKAMEAAGIPDAKWKNYSLDPSNPSYRETVLHLPGNKGYNENVFNQRASEAYEAVRSAGGTDEQATEILGDIGAASGGDTRVWLPPQFEVPSVRDAVERALDATKKHPDFLSGHFPEPNIIGHMMTSMVKHEGKPVYLIDQIQSDWGQKLRDTERYKPEDVARLKEQIAAIEPDYKALMYRAREASKSDLRHRVANDHDLQEWLRSNGSDQDRAIHAEYNRLQAEKFQIEETLGVQTPRHPLVNTTDQWVNTTLRRAIRQAAEAGADYIAIPHGDTVLSYNPGDQAGMRGFYGSRSSEGIVPKNLRKLIERIDKDSSRPVKVGALDAPSGTRGYRPDAQGKFDKSQTGFTLFPITDKVRQSVMTEGQAMFAFAGERARTADLDALAKAKEMEKDGKPREDIWRDTGWFRGVDGKWRFEIDDSASKHRSVPYRLKTEHTTPGLLSERFDHPALYDAYPEMRDIPTEWTRGAFPLEPQGSYVRAIGSRPERMELTGSSPSTFRRIALHEAQHVIQKTEGFASGANRFSATEAQIDAAMQQLKASRGLLGFLTYREEAVWRAYASFAGEAESRLVEKRRNMTAEQRRARPPWLDYDIPEENQIVRFADGKSASLYAFSEQPPVDGPAMRGLVMYAIKAYHGSPHDFDRFSLDKIGTGEGAQAYGHGLYFAENEGVARSYRDALSHPYSVLDPAGHAARFMRDGGDKQAALRLLESEAARYKGQSVFQKMYADSRRMIESGEQLPPLGGAGRLYEVRINADPEHFLDWDKPLSQQSEMVRGAIEAEQRRYYGSQFEGQAPLYADKPIHEALLAINPRNAMPASLANQLREAGIPGIRYLDQGSRSAGDGSRNYVVFDDALIEIVAKDGKPVDPKEKADVVAGLSSRPGDGEKMYALRDWFRERRLPGYMDESTIDPAQLMPFREAPRSGKVLMFHATAKTFNTFDMGKSKDFGIHFGTPDQGMRRLDDTGSVEGGRTIPVQIELQNAVRMNDPGYWGPVDIVNELRRIGYAVDTETAMRMESLQADVNRADGLGPVGKPRLRSAIKAANAAIVDLLNENGIDGIWYRNKVEGGGWSLIVWNEGKVKSATTGDRMFALNDNAPEPKRPIDEDYGALDRLNQMKDLIEACA